MTREQGQLSSGLIAMILLIIMLWALSGCSANYHLRMAKKKGAEITIDTTWQTFHFKSPEIKFETTLRPTWQNHRLQRSLAEDTLVANDPKSGATTKVKIDLAQNCPDSCIKEVYIKTEVPPQDLKEEIPVANNTTIKSGHGFWYDMKLVIISLITGALAMFILIRRGPLRNFNIRIDNDKPP